MKTKPQRGDKISKIVVMPHSGQMITFIVHNKHYEIADGLVSFTDAKTQTTRRYPTHKVEIEDEAEYEPRN